MVQLALNHRLKHLDLWGKQVIQPAPDFSLAFAGRMAMAERLRHPAGSGVTLSATPISYSYQPGHLFFHGPGGGSFKAFEADFQIAFYPGTEKQAEITPAGIASEVGAEFPLDQSLRWVVGFCKPDQA